MAINENQAASLDKALLKAVRDWTAVTMPGRHPDTHLVVAVMVRAIGKMLEPIPNDGDKIQLTSDALEALLTLSGVPQQLIVDYRRRFRHDALRLVLPQGNA
jgi:hypothetical protein